MVDKTLIKRRKSKEYRSIYSNIVLECQHNVLDDLEDNKGSDTVYPDFSKEYGKCEIGVLLHKLKEAGVTGRVGIWIAGCGCRGSLLIPQPIYL